MLNREANAERPKDGRPVGSFRNLSSSVIARWGIFLGLALLALAVRLPGLDERPMHTDEAINAYIIGDLLVGSSFRYDPRDRHGPVLYLVAEPLARLCGAGRFSELTETELRLTPVIAGSATVLLFGAGVDLFGFIPCLVAALLFAVAPLPVYYSRDFIHETLFVAATLGLALSAWRALKTNSIGAAAIAGLSAALLVGCKETFVIHVFALGLAAAARWFVQPGEIRPSLKPLIAALGVFAVAVIALFTWFGRNWQGLADLLRAGPHLVARASGEGHQKAFGYYLGLLNPAFVFAPLAVVGVYASIRDAVAGNRKAGVLLTVYAFAIFFTYSTIPYKTPWLALNLWLPLTLLCGLGIELIWKTLPSKPIRAGGVVAAGAILALLGSQTVRLVFAHPADAKNPLAYAQTGEDLLRLPPRLQQLAANQKLTQPLIAVVAADPWPLPWYLRTFANVGCWQPGQDPGNADFYLTSPAAAEQLRDKLKDRRPEFFGVRPEVLVILWPPKTAPP